MFEFMDVLRLAKIKLAIFSIAKSAVNVNVLASELAHGLVSILPANYQDVQKRPRGFTKGFVKICANRQTKKETLVDLYITGLQL